MKTERRHELQTNTLAQSLAEGIEKIRPYVNHILLGIGVAVVLLLALTFFRSQARAKQASAWEAYFVATTPSETSAESQQDRLRRVLKDFSDTDMADWAKLTIGDDGLNTASQLISSNKSDARKNINAAIAEYRPLGESSKVPQVRNLANYNLGLCHEMLGEVDKAVESYRKVNGALAKLAQARVEALEKNVEVREFYKWFAAAEPAAQAISGGSMPGRMPPFKVDDPEKATPFEDAPGAKSGESDLPPVELFPKDPAGTKTPENSGDVKLPGLESDPPATPDTTTPDSTTPEAAAPATEDPAKTPETESPAPAAETSADPATEKPAEVATSSTAEEKPAEAAPAAAETPSPAPAKSE